MEKFETDTVITILQRQALNPESIEEIMEFIKSKSHKLTFKGTDVGEGRPNDPSSEWNGA